MEPTRNKKGRIKIKKIEMIAYLEPLCYSANRLCCYEKETKASKRIPKSTEAGYDSSESYPASNVSLHIHH